MKPKPASVNVRLWLLLLVLPVAAGAIIIGVRALSAAAAASRTRQSTPEDATNLSVELLEAEKYKEWFEALVLPAEVARITQAGRLDQEVENFRTQKAPTVLRIHKQIQGQEPQFTEDGKALFQYVVEEKKGLTKRLTYFVRSGDGWYVVLGGREPESKR